MTMDSSYGDRVLLCRVSPFGYPRIIACFRLPVAFRRSLRPSSAPSAKASPLRSCSLDHSVRHRCLASVQSCSNHFWVLLSLANCKNKRQSLDFLIFEKFFNSSLCFLVSLFSFQGSGEIFRSLGGLKWTRTTDLTLIRRAL